VGETGSSGASVVVMSDYGPLRMLEQNVWSLKMTGHTVARSSENDSAYFAVANDSLFFF
jgi:hypothetical protein